MLHNKPVSQATNAYILTISLLLIKSIFYQLILYLPNNILGREHSVETWSAHPNLNQFFEK